MAGLLNVQHYHSHPGDQGQVSPGYDLRDVVDEYLPGELMAVCTDTQAYSAQMLRSSQVKVGQKRRAVFTHTDSFNKLAKDVKKLKHDVKDLRADAVKYGAIFLCVTATQALLFAAGAESTHQTNRRFFKMHQVRDSRLTQYTEVVNSKQPFNSNEQVVAEGLDQVINSRNAMVHVKTEAEFFQSYIVPAQEMLRRHPGLREKYITECLAIDTYSSLKSCFQF